MIAPTSARIPLGAPGIYTLPPEPVRALTGVRMDVCAFVGIAPRGPARVPVFDEHWRDDRPCVEPGRPRRRTTAVPVESFDAYRRLYGGFEGPGRLPYAVATFFEQGGRRAYIARIVHDDHITSPDGVASPDAAGTACGVLAGAATTAGTLALRARNEGAWGNRLRAVLRFTTRPLHLLAATATDLTPASADAVSAGTLLRLSLGGGVRALRFVLGVVEVRRDDTAAVQWRARLDGAVTAPIEAAEVVEGLLLVDDGDGRAERHERLGLSARHPRWMATVLCYESSLVYPVASWIDADILPVAPDRPDVAPPQDGEPLRCDESRFVYPGAAWIDAELLPDVAGRPDVDPPRDRAQFRGGEDRYAPITPDDFFDPSWLPGNDEPGAGVHALVDLPDLSLVVVPDLYDPATWTAREPVVDPVTPAGPTFQTCLAAPPPAPQAPVAVGALDGLSLDPRVPGDLEAIVGYQARLVELAEEMRSFHVLLDVPPRLSQRQVVAWRGRFDSAFAAAYLPWLVLARTDDGRDGLVRIGPSAVAAGLIARREIASGVPYGPANLLAAGVVDVDEAIPPRRHDALHPLGLNVFLRERDGILLTAARTLGGDPSYRQLSVRRLMTMLRRALEEQMSWVAFEPNHASLRANLRVLLGHYLGDLYRAGAFRGATEDEAFFVRCGADLNPPGVQDLGRLVVEIGVAPAEPLEFLVLRLVRDGDGTLSLEDQRGSRGG
jgi:hypothetical protein